MAIDFNGTTDRINYANVFDTSAVAISVAAWIYPDAFAHNSIIAVTHASGDAAQDVVCRVLTSQRLNFNRTTNATVKVRTTTETTTGSAWNHAAWTDDGTLTATGCLMYINGAAAGSYAATTNGTGTENTGTGSVSVGGRIFDDTVNLNGRIAEVGIWNVILTAAEIASLGKGFSPLFIRPQSLVFYAPLIRSVNDLKGKTGTLDGTAVIEHPKIIYPARKIINPFVTTGATPLTQATADDMNNEAELLELINGYNLNLVANG